MIRKIKTKDIRVGMHVIIPASWINHSFAKNQFNIKSGDQIRKIMDRGFDEVGIDTSKGMPVTAF